jgi:hypothetical protein
LEEEELVEWVLRKAMEETLHTLEEEVLLDGHTGKLAKPVVASTPSSRNRRGKPVVAWQNHAECPTIVVASQNITTTPSSKLVVMWFPSSQNQQGKPVVASTPYASFQNRRGRQTRDTSPANESNPAPNEPNLTMNRGLITTTPSFVSKLTNKEVPLGWSRNLRS